MATVAVAAVAVTAIVATAGAAGAAVGVAAGMYLGVSSATAVTISTVATAGGYALAGAIGATALSDAGEELTGTNVIRDKLMGGNQDLYNTVEAGLYTVGMGYTSIGADNYGLSGGINGSKVQSKPLNSSKPNQMHHFATNKNKKYTPKFEKITNKYGLDLDGAWNKRSLPHQGRHPNAYHEYILKQIKQCDSYAKGNQKKFLSAYEKTKNRVINNPDMLYKSYWNERR